MSISKMTSVWESAPFKGSELLLLLALADYANEEGEAWPSQASLASRMRMSERQVRRLIGVLEQGGALVIETYRKGRKQHNRYVLTTGHLVRSNGSTTGHLGSFGADIAMSGDPSIEPPLEPLAAAPQKEKLGKPRNIVWDALVDVCGVGPNTPSEQADFGKTVSELRKVIPQEATIAEIIAALRGRRARWLQLHPDVVFNHRTLRNHWSSLGGQRSLHAGEPQSYDGDSFGRPLEDGVF